MQKLSLVFLIFSFLFFGGFIVSFFISRTIIIESSQNFSVDDSGSIDNTYELAGLSLSISAADKERDNYQDFNNGSSHFPEISAKSYLIADLDSGFIFAEKRPQEKFTIASLTKLMTAIVVAENIDLRESIVVKPEMLEPYGSTEGLEAEKSFKAFELFYPLLIESSNDAAEVLSYFLDPIKTIEMMNEKAKAILMENTEFVDSHGLGIENISTARDILKLTRYVTEFWPLFWEISKGKTVWNFEETSFGIKELWNKNIFINDQSFVGGKTGFLPKSRYSAVFIFKFFNDSRENRNIAIILLRSENNKTDAQRICKWIQENYFLSPAFSAL